MIPLVFGRILFYNQQPPDHYSPGDNGAVATVISLDNGTFLHRLLTGFLKGPEPISLWIPTYYTETSETIPYLFRYFCFHFLSFPRPVPQTSACLYWVDMAVMTNGTENSTLHCPYYTL